MSQSLRIPSRLVLLAASGFIHAAAGAPGPAAGAVRTEHITDPTLSNMVAFDVTVPAKWHFQGTLGQGGQCVIVPFQVFRMTSPDGLSFIERMPVLGWYWGTGPAAKVKTTDCLPLKEAIGAQDFLKYVAALLKVEYVADEPVPAEENARVQKSVADAAAALGPGAKAGPMSPPRQTKQVARAIVRYRNGTFTMKGLLETEVDCSETTFRGMKSGLQGMPDTPSWTSNRCSAGVRYTVAPENQYAATVSMLNGNRIGATASPAWVQAWLQRSQRQNNEMLQRSAAQANAQLAANAAQFNHDQAVRQHMHEQFLATMQRGTDMSMARAAQVANSNHTIASDWVDYSLNQQTVRDPATGQVSKVTSGYNATWVDSSGKVSYQTNDPNANPNGTLPGTWSQQQAVHGDGTN